MPMTQLTTFFTQLQKAKGATERILNTGCREESIMAGDEVTNTNQRLSIENLSFGYKPDGLPA